MTVDYLQKILTAKVYDVAIESPLDLAPTLSRRIGNRVLLKREDQQPVFSFKLRGAYNKMAHLSAAERSARRDHRVGRQSRAGSRACGAEACCKATIVMPVTTPSIKIQAVEARGAKVVLHGDSFSDAYKHSLKLQKAQRIDFRPSLRRPRRDCRSRDDRGGNPAPMAGAHRRHLRRDRRRRPDFRHRLVRQARAAGNQGHRRAARGLGRDGTLHRGRTPRSSSTMSVCSPMASR